VKVLVLGGAVSGRAAARLALRLGHEVAIYDRDPAATADAPEAAAVSTGEWDAQLLDAVDLVVTSPGIPEHATPIQAALAGPAPLVSELEFAARQLTAPYVAITGTNGKTTVTEATAAMLRAAGMRACAAGNVGLALSDVALDRWDCVAVEASSFQLRFIDRFHPKAAAILNIAPDHLDWHGTLDAYAAAKARIWENQTEHDVLVYDADDAGAVRAARPARARRIGASGVARPPGGNGPETDRLLVGDMTFPHPGLDAIWMLDLTVSATLAAAVGTPAEAIGRVIAGFAPGTHRRTVVARSGGVTWVNDSKATNPHAAVASAGAYASVVLIAGGRNKGLDLAPLVAVPTVRHVMAIGEAAAELAAAGGDKVRVVDDMEQAVTWAASIAVAGDTVLLAPGCASFDMFDSYQHRGEVFTALVRTLVGGGAA
jgi:UDP-N-acetylmuramoylalanine--D-glutamate ligase